MQKMLHVISFICLCIFPVVGEDTCETSINGASGFIGKLVDEALEIVNKGNASDDVKRQQLSECINKYLDIDRITKSVFTPFGYKDLREDEKQKVRDYLKKYLITFYAGEGKLSAMVNAKLSGQLATEKKDNDFAVISQFEKNSSPAIKIVWITNGQKVFYVEIEGINQIITLRAEMKGKIGSGTLMDYINKQ